MTITIETPKGSHEKLKYEPRQGKFIVNKQMPEGMTFPFDFGFVPQTRGDDGDPLDILILSQRTHNTGTSLNVRILGCLPAKQTDEQGTISNDRYVGTPDDDDTYQAIRSIEQLPDETLNSIRSFFINYLSAEGKQIVFLPMLTAQHAGQLLQLAKS